MTHVSDTHLGYAEYDARDPDSGLNAREQDVYRSFRAACPQIRRLQPDLLIHAGDLFDTPRPPNEAFITAFRELSVLARDGIPILVVAGNHSLPARPGAACILEALEAIQGICVAGTEGVAIEGSRPGR